MHLMSLIKYSSIISLLFPPGHASQFLCFVSSLQILSKEDHLPAAIALGRRRLAATHCSSHLICFFPFCFKGKCTVQDKPWEIQGKILFHHAFRPFKAQVHPLKNITLNRHIVHSHIIHVLFAGWL